MIKRIVGLTVLIFALSFGGIVQNNVDAAAGITGKQNDFNKFKSYFNNCTFVWKNGKFNVEKNDQQENDNEIIENDEQEVNDNDAVENNNQEVENNEQEMNDQTEVEDSSLNAFEREVFNLTNVERTKQGLAPLQIDNELSKVAREKSRDMAVNNYFDHNSPTYGSPFDMMRSYGISYRTAGENIAKGQRSPEEVVKAWMNSPGHRENILNSNYTHIGVGYVEQGNFWTQQFIGK